MIRVLHIITRMDMGGSAQNTLMTCSALARKYEIILGFGPTRESNMTATEILSVSAGINEARRNGAHIVRIEHLVRRLRLPDDVVAFWEIVKILRRFRPHILHTHSSKAGLLARLAAKITNTPIVIHTPHGHVFSGHFGRVASWVFLAIERLMTPITDVIIALTKGEMDDYIELHVAPREKLVKIHSGVPIHRFSILTLNQGQERRRLGIPPDGPLIGTVGWLLPIKGPDILLEAMQRVWERFPNAKLAFVGKGDMLDSLKATAARIGKQDAVYFLGWRQDIWNIMPLLDVFVLPSRNEGMGRVLVEAMAAARPVIGSRVGGIPDLIEQGVNGLMFQNQNHNELASAIVRILSDPKMANRMGLAGRDKSKAFSTEAMIEKLDLLYQRLLKQKKVTCK